MVNTYNNMVKLQGSNAGFTIVCIVVDSGFEGPQSRLNNLSGLFPWLIFRHIASAHNKRQNQLASAPQRTWVSHYRIESAFVSTIYAAARVFSKSF